MRQSRMRLKKLSAILDNETYKTGATVNVKINVKDVDSTKCEVIVGFVDGDEVTYQQIKSTQNTNSEFVIQYQLPKVVSILTGY